jgi:hypothetical protein
MEIRPISTESDRIREIRSLGESQSHSADRDQTMIGIDTILIEWCVNPSENVISTFRRHHLHEADSNPNMPVKATFCQYCGIPLGKSR